MPTRFRKMRRLRGSRTHGYGQVGQHRHSGKQGGHGAAGLHKHKWSWLILNDPDHFGRDPFKVPGSQKISKWLNVGDLDRVADRTNGGQQQQQAVSVDLVSLGYEKLLGSGTVRRAFNVRVAAFTERAKTKLEKAGGSIVS